MEGTSPKETFSGRSSSSKGPRLKLAAKRPARPAGYQCRGVHMYPSSLRFLSRTAKEGTVIPFPSINAEVRPMVYEGQPMNVCNAELFNFGDTYAVVVSGGGANAHGTEKLNKFICGHLLLNVGGQGGRYFHVAGE